MRLYSAQFVRFTAVLPQIRNIYHVYLLAPVQTIFPELKMRAVVLGSRILIITAAKRFANRENNYKDSAMILTLASWIFKGVPHEISVIIIRTSMESLPLDCIRRYAPEVQWISGPEDKQGSRLTQYS